MEPFNWTCPFCGHKTTITEPNCAFDSKQIDTTKSKFENCTLQWSAIACPNDDCKELYLNVSLHRYGLKNTPVGRQWAALEVFDDCDWELRPESRAKPQPDYMPQEIRSTYREACRIMNLSPKASATLSRRCLQGMIRDFWKVNNKPNLYQEIDAVKDQVAPDTWDAIDAVRKVGNIGAHMEKDTNVIVDVDPGEAEILIELIETLFVDWYVDREKRRLRNATIKAVAAQKDAERAKLT